MGSSPVRRVTRRLQFLGQQVVPDTADDEDKEAVVLPVLPQALDPDPVRDQPAGPAPMSPGPVGQIETEARGQRVLRPRGPATYRDNRAWIRRKMLSGFLGVPTTSLIKLAEPVDIEMAAGELSELQRQEISVEADLDSKAPTFRVLDFLEEVFLVAASGEYLEDSLLTMARRLLEGTSDVLGILDTLRSLVSDSDNGGTAQRKCEPEADSGVESASEESAFLAQHSVHRPRQAPVFNQRWGSGGGA